MIDLYILFSGFIILVLTAGFIYFAFKRYEVAVFVVAFSSWVPYIFFNNSYESIIQEEAGIGSYIRILLILAMGVVGLVKFIKYWPQHKGRLPLHFILLGLFLVIALVSILYSIDSNITFIRAATFVGLFSFLLGLYAWIKEEEQLDKLLNTLYYLILIFTALSILGMVAMPGRVWWWNISNRFIGIWGHPNTTGIFCLTAYPVLLWKFNESNTYGKILIIGLFLAVLFMHILTGSRTSLIASLIGICIWFIVQKKGVKILAILIFVGLFAFILMEFQPGSFQRAGSKEFTSVTGRDQFWNATTMLILERPLTGYGYAVEGKVWNDPRFNKEGYALWSGSNRTSIHNGYLSIAVGVGLIGFLIWAAILLIPLFRGIKSNRSFYKAFALSIMVMMLLANFAESALDSANTIGAVFFWIAWVIAAKLLEIEKQGSEEPEFSEELEESYAA